MTARVQKILERFAEECPDGLTADGFDGALIGLVEGACRQPVACYDYRACIRILKRRGMSEEEAEEWMDFNVTDAYVGEMTPLFLHDWRRV